MDGYAAPVPGTLHLCAQRAALVRPRAEPDANEAAAPARLALCGYQPSPAAGLSAPLPRAGGGDGRPACPARPARLRRTGLLRRRLRLHVDQPARLLRWPLLPQLVPGDTRRCLSVCPGDRT